MAISPNPSQNPSGNRPASYANDAPTGLAFTNSRGCLRWASGPPIFFECNTNAEWYWVEWMTGHPLSKAVAEELIRTALPQGSHC